MVGGGDIIRKLFRGFKKTRSLQLLVQRILKTKTRCADGLKAQKQEITYKESTKAAQSNKPLMIQKSSEVRLIYLQILKHEQRCG